MLVLVVAIGIMVALGVTYALMRSESEQTGSALSGSQAAAPLRTASSAPSALMTPSEKPSDYSTGFLKSVSRQDEVYFITIEAADFISDPSAPDGYRIVLHPANVQQFQVANDATLTIVGDDLQLLSDSGVLNHNRNAAPTESVAFNTFASSYESHGFQWQNTPIMNKLFHFEFQSSTIIELQEQYTP